jgi:hypothetical protein
MNLWKAIFRAELHRGRFFLIALVLLHALGFYVKAFLPGATGGEMGPLSAAVPAIGWTIHAIGLICIIGSLWFDSPTRSETHLRFRPVTFRDLTAPKFTAFLLIVAVPAILAEAAILRFTGAPGRTLWLGILQTACISVAFIAAPFPLAWLWKKWGHGLLAAITVIAACCGLAILALSRFWIPNNGTALWDTFRSPPFLLTWAAIATVACCGLFLLQRRIRLPLVARLTAFSLIILGGMMLSWRLQLRQEPTQEEKPSALVKMTIKRFSPEGKPGYTWLELTPVPPDLQPGEEVLWNFSRLSMNGRKINVLPSRNLSSPERYSDYSLAMLHAVSGDAKVAPEAPRPYNDLDSYRNRNIAVPFSAKLSSAATLRINDLPSDPAFQIEAGLRGTVIRWAVVLNQPLGSALTEVTFREPLHPLWLGNRIEDERGPLLPYRCFIHYPDRNAVINVPVAAADDPQLGRARSMGDGNVAIERQSSFMRTLTLSPSLPPGVNGARFIVMRPMPVRHMDASWKSTQPVIPTQLRNTPKPEMVIEGEGAHRAIRWLSRHPVPEAGASSEETSAWLRRFIPLINSPGAGQIPPREEYDRITETLKSIARHHPDELLENGKLLGNFPGDAGWILFAASDVITPEIIRRRPDEEIDFYWAELIKQRGWLDQFPNYALRQTRAGQGWKVRNFLQAGDTAKGLTKEEAIALLKLNPSASTYEIALKCGVSREKLAPIIEAIVRPALPASRGPTEHLVGLAMAAGHPEAMEWCLVTVWKFGYLPQIEFWQKMFSYLALPEGFSDRRPAQVIEWLKEKQSSDFVFDSAIGKFRLK